MLGNVFNQTQLAYGKFRVEESYSNQNLLMAQAWPLETLS